MIGPIQPQQGMQLFDAEGRRLYCTEEERRAFVAAAAKAPREVRTFCGTLHATGCRISEALALTADRIDLTGRVIVFGSLKKRRGGVNRAVPVPRRSRGLLNRPWAMVVNRWADRPPGWPVEPPAAMD